MSDAPATPTLKKPYVAFATVLDHACKVFGCSYERSKASDGRVFFTFKRNGEVVLGHGANNSEALDNVIQRATRLWGPQ